MSNTPRLITPEWLREHPEYIFVFGDNLRRWGKKGAAICRDEPNAYGFITKKYPSNRDDSFYRPEEYEEVFRKEFIKLQVYIMETPDKTFLVSRLGAGLANKYGIYEKVIKSRLLDLSQHQSFYRRVILLP